MHLSKKIKICKIESQSFAKFCLLRGADYLGVHVIDFALDKNKQALSQYIGSLNGKTVLLTKERDQQKLKKLVDFYQPWALQLHYEITPAVQKELETVLGIRLVPVITNDTAIEDVRGLLDNSEFAVYDTSFKGGTGQVHDQRILEQLGEDFANKVLLAGGITPEVVANQKLPLGGYDVQSYCREDGRHHYGKTEKMMDAVKGFDKKQLSISLTDASGLDTIPKYTDVKSIEYHLDYSEGNLYSHLTFDTAKIKSIISTVDAPFTVHIFEAEVLSFQRVIDEFMAIAKNNIVRINIQYSNNLKIEDIDTYNAKLCASLYYKDAAEYLTQYPNQHPCISIILPTELPRKVETLAEQKADFDLMHDKEVWFDRKVDLETIKLVRSYYPETNFIAGKYIIEDLSREALLINELLS